MPVLIRNPDVAFPFGTVAPLARAVSPRACFTAILFAAIFLQRFALPLGPNGVGFNLCVTLGALALLAWRGALVIDPGRAVAACSFAAVAWFAMLLNPLGSSPGSIGLVMAMWLPFALALRQPGSAFADAIAAFQTMVLVCAFCGIAQFIGQFAVPARYIFTFRGLLPEPILLAAVSEFQPLGWGANLYRSNGFFTEPSTCSQFMALAILFELLFRGTTWRLPVYALSLALAYSGTGLLLLGIMLPFVMLHRRDFTAIALLGLLGLLGLLAIGFGDVLNIDTFLARSSEFGEEGTSATARYVAPVWLLRTVLFEQLQGVVFGLGPGSYAVHALAMAHETHDPVWAKLLFEYGLVGVAAFLPLYILAVFTDAPSRWVSVALTIGFLTFGGTLLDPRTHALLLVFCVLPKRNPGTRPGIVA